MHWIIPLAMLLAEAAEPERPAYVVMDGLAGIHRYAPGTWGMVGVTVSNPTDRPIELLSSTSFEGQPGLQYARVLWVPAQAMRKSWQPVLPPLTLPPGKSPVAIRCLLTDLSDGSTIKSPLGQLFHEGILPIVQHRPVTGVLADGDSGEQRDLLAVARLVAGKDPAVADLYTAPLPPSEELLAGLDQLVLCSNRIAGDAAGWAAVRRWLRGGGSLWIMLDRVDPATVTLLLGDRWRCHVVDRVGLTRVDIERFRPGPGERPRPQRRFDVPVDLVRVLPEDVAVSYTVNGWPAAMWLPVGEGRVLVTTLGARAWIRSRTPEALLPDELPGTLPAKASPVQAPYPFFQPSPEDFRYTSFPLPTDELKELAAEFLQVAEPPGPNTEKLDQFVAEQIGYQIVGRRTVVGLLGGFCVALVLSGLWLARRGKLERLAWIGPALAAAAAAGLAAAGHATRTSVPDMVAVAQRVDVDPAVNEVRVRGLMGIYHQQPADLPLGAQRGGIVGLDMEGLGGTTRRMVWTDLDRWHWENLAVPAGMRTATLSWASGLRDGPIRVRATLGPGGLTATLEAGPLEDVRDLVLTSGLGRNLALRMERDGRFVGGPADVLAPGQVAAGALVDDRQRWMQSLARELLDQPAVRRRYRAEPTVLAWASPLEMGFRLSEGLERVGGALVAIPLALEPTAPDVDVLIPSPLLSYESVTWPGELSPSAAYSRQEGAWMGPLPQGARTMLRFRCPPQVLPLRVTRAGLSLTINAPSRQVEVFGVSGQELISLARLSGPMGTHRLSLDRPEALRLDPEGGLRVGIAVGDVEQWTIVDKSSLVWKIEEVELEIAGHTLKP